MTLRFGVLILSKGEHNLLKKIKRYYESFLHTNLTITSYYGKLYFFWKITIHSSSLLLDNGEHDFPLKFNTILRIANAPYFNY